MAKILSLNGIVTGQTVEAEHVSQSILALTGLEAYDLTISGSLNVIGTSSFQMVSGSDFSGSYQGDGSRLTGITSSFITGSNVYGPFGANSILSSSYAATSSISGFATIASSSLVADRTLASDSATSASHAQTASYAHTASYVLGTVETASFITASNVWGPYGSSSIESASFAISSSIAQTASFTISSSYSFTSSYSLEALSSSIATTASYVKNAETASYIDGAFVGAGGQDSQIQYNNNGIIAGAFGFMYSQSNGSISIGTSSYTDHQLEVAGQIAQTGINCSVALGRNALINQSSGRNNVAIGEGAMLCADSSLLNVAVGFQALRDNDAAERNVAIGHQALRSTVSPNNVAVGAQALYSSISGKDNIGIGNCALYTNTTGRCNIGIGSRALVLTNEGIQNIGIGFQSLENVTDGRGNTVIGHEALKSINRGRDNVAVGWNAGFLAANSSTGNVFLGRCAGPSISETLSNKLFIHNTQGSPLICGDFSDMQISINGALTASGIIYPTADGTANQVLKTDGNGRLSFGLSSVDTSSYVSSSNIDGPLGMDSVESASFSLTASFITGSNVYGPYGSNSIVSSSYALSSSYAIKNIITASADGSNITFTKGDGSTFEVTVGVGGVGASPYSTGSESTSIIPVLGNSINSGSNSNIAGGCLNQISPAADCSSILGGYANINSGSYSSIVGGTSNTASGAYSVIVGGDGNTVSGPHSFAGGCGSIVTGCNSFAYGGCSPSLGNIEVPGHFSVGLGFATKTSGSDSFAMGHGSTAAGHGVQAMGYCAHAGIFGANPDSHRGNTAMGTFVYASGSNSTVFGAYNYAIGNCSNVLGGYQNQACANCSTIVGGSSNQVSGSNSFIGAGFLNMISIIGCCSAIVGGHNNCIHEDDSFIGGGHGNEITTSGNNQGWATIGGGQFNCTGCGGAAVLGGAQNEALGCLSFVGGGFCNRNNACYGVIGGGCQNNISSLACRASILGGSQNTVSGSYSSVLGGDSNCVTGICSSILGGASNTLTHAKSFIVGSNLTSDKACYTFMNNLDVEGTVSGSTFSGSYVGDGSGLTNLNITSNITTYNDNIRYEAYNSTQIVEILSTGTIYSGLDWTRSSTTLTIFSPSHGLVAGDYVVIRNMGDTDYSYLVVSNVATNRFDVTVADSGAIVGSLGAYIPAARVTSVTEAGATILSPTVGNIQIQSIKVITGTKFTAGFTLTMPASIDNGAGANTSLTNQNPPLLSAYRLDTGGFNASATIILNTSTNFNVFNVSNLTNLKNNLIRFTF